MTSYPDCPICIDEQTFDTGSTDDLAGSVATPDGPQFYSLSFDGKSGDEHAMYVADTIPDDGTWEVYNRDAGLWDVQTWQRYGQHPVEARKVTRPDVTITLTAEHAEQVRDAYDNLSGGVVVEGWLTDPINELVVQVHNTVGCTL